MRYHPEVGVDSDEADARATLVAMQTRLAAGPYAVLAVAPNATASEARSAFLELTKLYHPARFGRMSTELQRLANEVFLGIKGAHEALAKTSGWSLRGQPGSQPSTRPPTSVPVQVQGGARGTGGVRQTHPTPVQGMPAQPLSTQPRAGTNAGPGSARPATVQPPTQMQPAPSRPTTTSPAGARPSTPSPAPVPTSRPTTPSPAPTAPSRTAPATVQPWKPSVSTPTRAASPVPTASASGTGSGAVRAPAGTFDERAELMLVMDLVRKGQWPGARAALQNLAARVPTSTHYKALLSYARAREAQMAGRPAEAILELQRALELDPNLSLAKTALAEMQTRKK